MTHEPVPQLIAEVSTRRVPPQRLSSPYRPEAEAAGAALESLEGRLDWERVAAIATPWVEAVRRDPAPFWALESLLAEYPISSDEGLALMRLAEALLRVPDRETAIALTADQLGRADFSSHRGRGLAAVSARALALAKSMLPDADDAHQSLVRRLGADAVVTIASRAVQLLARQFVLGETIEAAIARADEWRGDNRQFRFSYDMLGEGARTDAAAQAYLDHYRLAVEAVAAGAGAQRAPEDRDGISIKLSALFARYEEAQHARVMRNLVPRVWSLCQQASAAGLNLTIDAEESERLELSLDIFEALTRLVARTHPQWSGLGLAIQAYQTRALDVVSHVVELARRTQLRFMLRLVKGAYWDTEIKRAQVLGVDGYPVFTHKHHTDLSYLACARALLAAPDAVYPQLASHNAATIAAVLELARESGASFELQRLHGMGESIYRQVLQSASVPCRIYAPVGQYRDLLAYLVRRLLENGANSSFVHQLADRSVAIDELVHSPLYVESDAALPLPRELYGPERSNSRGLDIAVRSDRERLLDAYSKAAMLAGCDLGIEDVERTMAMLERGARCWDQQPVQKRAAMLNAAADTLEAALPHWAALLLKEAHKTWDDAIAEVREAIDFLRYYAVEAQRIMAPVALPGPTGETNELRLRGRGVWVCISPWNFPLAIFTGQMAAALVTGNAVAAKPAEQTPAIAAAMVDLLHGCGVPKDALALCPGEGETIGAALVADRRTAGVVFTGSTPVARAIARSLLATDDTRALVPLIAETGGINAMIVDTTALPEQVVDAAIASTFRSAGQRCSALRLLCLHESTAESLLEMLSGALNELVIGEPADPATDVGPVIDAAARAQLEKQISRLERTGRLVAGAALPAGLSGEYVAPCIYEIDRVEAAEEEIFGPVLLVVRWSGELDALIERVNALGFGLTLGVQTRLDGRAERIATCARVGNIYVNRSMIGAVVGVQPFGGEGLSGTGPKAGGPQYLPRFCVEQTVTVNTAAAGGNAALLASVRG
ncbi:MAG TPA: bifunctional proline dehydrogenase/L-glutamate gamma-semialdehyde dehydrogenase PutA [Burkholderiales bacterium]|nr:bifunctional proline dehydrogenase/L-glutamate gamma-semialdehyde dehydrogenase PutA [Burkholderiales bacterium]